MMSIYLIGTAATALGAYAESRFFRDDAESAHPNLVGVAVFAGLVWPVVLFGVVLGLRRCARWMYPTESRGLRFDDADAEALWDWAAKEDLRTRAS
jgi:hypothetical protein